MASRSRLAEQRVLGGPQPERRQLFAQDRPGYDPPTLTGMRGSHDGSYDYSHALRDA